MTLNEVGIAFCQLLDQVNDKVFQHKNAVMEKITNEECN